MKSIQVLALAGIALACLSAGPASATQGEQLLLPVQLSAGCQACHSGAGVTPTAVPAAVSSELTSFGSDWVSFGREWNPGIAGANSDSDGCSNGFELGDPLGDWELEDGYISIGEDMNPAAAGDCLLPVDERSFGVLKSLFGD